MSKFLGIDTSSRYLTVVAENDGKTVLRSLTDCAMRHSVLLMDEIEKAFAEAGLSPADCDFFAVVTGPGSFTGIRIGISAAKGFALATGKPLLPVTSFELIAYNVEDENFCVCIDAAHSHVYVCGYGAGKKVTLAPSYLTFDEAEGLGVKLYGFEDLPFKNYKKLDAAKCLHPAICRGLGNLSRNAHALYVRKSQAEEQLCKSETGNTKTS